MKIKYEITRDIDHNYSVSYNGKITTLPSTTRILEIVGSRDKTDRLMAWAKKNALERVREYLRPMCGTPVTINETWIEQMRKSAWDRDREVFKAAGDIGTDIHTAIDEFIAGKDPVITPQTEPGFKNFIKWLSTSDIEIIRGDTYVASLELGYGGAMDALGIKGEHLVICDWKTSGSLNPTYALQTAAYAIAFEETFDAKVDYGYVVRFGKKIPGDVEIRQVNMERARAAFTQALYLHKAMKNPVWVEENENHDRTD